MQMQLKAMTLDDSR